MILGKWLCNRGRHRIIPQHESPRRNPGPPLIIAVSCARNQCEYRRETPRPPMPTSQGETPCAD